MKKFQIFISLVILFFFLFSLDICAQTIEQEPNNTVQQANVLKLNDSLSGNINPTGDVDWFKATTNNDGRLELTLYNKNTKNSLHLQLFDGDSATQLHDTIIPAKASLTMMTDGLGEGTYFIKVSGVSNSKGIYTLSDTLVAAAGNNDVEPNDIRETQSVPFNLNDTITGHIGYSYNNEKDNNDYFTFTTTVDGNLNIVFKNIGSNNIVRCNLQDSINTAISGTFNKPGKETSVLSIVGARAGKYYLWITTELIDQPNFGSYSFSVVLDSVKHPNDVEPNNTPSQAQTLPVNSEAQGHIGYNYAFEYATDSADYYKLILSQDGFLKLRLTNDSYDWCNLDLYDADAQTLLKRIDTVQFEKNLFEDGLAAGTYFLKITPRGRPSFGTYTLRDSLVPYKYSADTMQESNNRPYLAKGILSNQSHQGHVGFYNNLTRDTADWWGLNYTDGSGNLRLNFHLLPALIESNIKALQVQVFSDTLLPAIYTGVLKDSADTISLTGLKQGLYYIKINCAIDSEWCAYSFTAHYNSVLAATFLKFTGTLQNNMTLLKWSTADEINAKGFFVERSGDGRNFTTIGFVKAIASSSFNTYNFTDNKPVNNTVYYRLKEVDEGGGYKYSSIISLHNNNKSNWYVTGDKDAKLILQLNATTKVSVVVTTTNGSIIKTIDKGSLIAGEYVIPLDISNQASGIYTVRLLLNDKAETKLFFK